MEDAQIIQLFFSRSEEAIKALAEKYGTSCQKLSINILQSSRDAEECVNDSYLTVWNRVPPANPSPFLPISAKLSGTFLLTGTGNATQPSGLMP